MWLKRSVAVDSHVTKTCFLVRSVRRRKSKAPHQNPVFLSVRDSGSTREEFHLVEAMHPTRIEEAVHQISETTLSRTGTRTTPNTSRNQATSSSAIGSSGGEHANKLAEPTVEGDNPMSEIKRPKRGATTHILSMSGTVEHTDRMSGAMECTEGCPGRKEDGKCCSQRISQCISRGRCRRCGRRTIQKSSCPWNSKLISSGRCQSMGQSNRQREQH